MLGALTWKFGLLAGVAGRSGVAAAPKLIRNNRTLPFSTLWEIRKNRRKDKRDDEGLKALF